MASWKTIAIFPYRCKGALLEFFGDLYKEDENVSNKEGYFIWLERPFRKLEIRRVDFECEAVKAP